MFKKTNLVLLGGPGAGKGTLSAMLKESAPFLHISTGDMLRAEVKAGTELGKQSQSIMENGGLVSDEIITAMVAKVLQKDEKKYGMILDGYPRTLNQAKMLDELLLKLNRPLDAVIYLHGSDDFLIKRLTSRIMCRKCNRIYNQYAFPPQKTGVCDDCNGEIYQRDDDSEASARKRLLTFHAQTQPLIKFYKAQGLLIQISCDEREAVLAETIKKLN
ncbi:MAG: adenylate kinase [Victivallaceae bacterium]|jgi:adenylate kinase|nr:adenylate kinase [Victivallaceae bacterium]NLK82704.1 adenylate kinase [Lentisphaerota bacterium]MDD3116806.1 adenylate kinase [Victivallaceae bacterium]MDD3702776.1 adenylate kinase [Victivallaceae bacterium]MDD4317464.1 adenylate kinase [Victivallaceae bacterium]